MMSIGGGNPMFDGLAVGANQQNAPSTTQTSATTTTPSARSNEGQNQNQSGGAQGQK